MTGGGRCRPRAIVAAALAVCLLPVGCGRAETPSAARPPARSRPSNRTVYYVDFAQGNDRNDGRTHATAWRHIPGTREASTFKSAYVTRTFGSGHIVAGVSRIKPGTVIRLKSGTTHNASLGGSVLVGGDFYENGTAAHPIVIEREATWGKGPVVFDGTGAKFEKWDQQFLIHRLSHIHLDGKGKGGIVLRNSAAGGVGIHGTAERKVAGTKLSDVHIEGFTSFGVSAYHLEGYEVTSVTVDGKAKPDTGGFHFGEWPCNDGRFRDCVAHHLGDEPGKQHGGTNVQIGFLLVNSRRVVYRHCTAYLNEGDGFDVGIHRATEATATNDVRYIDCTSWGNADGFGANAGEGLTHNQRITYVNCISRGNHAGGFNAYGGTAEYCFVHCLSAGNRDANYRLGPDGWRDHTAVVCRIYNSIGYKPDSAKVFHKSNLLTPYVKGAKFRLDSDHNYWAPKDPKVDRNFCTWDGYAGRAPYAREFNYQDGPGTLTSPWYTLDEDGHLYCDGNSLNAALGHRVLFADEAGHDYRLRAASHLRGKGLDLSRKPWYLKEMGIDRAGRKRTTWDIGPFEYIPAER